MTRVVTRVVTGTGKPVTTSAMEVEPLPLYSAEQVRAAEAPLLARGLGPELMRRAAHGLAHVTLKALARRRGHVYGARAVALVGPGNNGGDALFAAAILARRGLCTLAITVFPNRVHSEGRAAALAAGVRVTSSWEVGSAGFEALCEADVVLDGIFGTGSSGGLAEDLAARLEQWQSGQAGLAGHGGLAGRQLCIAVDAPTGVDASTGRIYSGAIRATHTVTFGLMKTGLVAGNSPDVCGEVTLVDIGLDAPEDPAGWHHTRISPHEPAPDDHKYSRGVLGLITGSELYPGAAVLTATAAQNTGVGMIRVATSAFDEVVRNVPEVVNAEGPVDAWVCGPGAPEKRVIEDTLNQAYAAGTPVVVDAGALPFVGDTCPTWVLTPHAGEAAALAQRVGMDVSARGIADEPGRAAVRLADHFGCVVLVKGPYTVVAEPGGRIHTTPRGPARLATAGSGDVLSGILGALLATTRPQSSGEAARSAAQAVLIHQRAAGRRALETARNVATVFK